MAWNEEGLRRDDGVFIGRNVAADTWVIFNHGAHLGHCPCCHKPLANERAARMVADVVWPEKVKD